MAWTIFTEGNAADAEALADALGRIGEPDGPASERRMRTAEALASYVVGRLEPVLLRRMLRREFGVREEAEAEALIRETMALLDGTGDLAAETDGSESDRPPSARMRRMARLFCAYLEEHDTLHVEGFVRFRMPEYRAEMREAAETALEERLMERQYQEFMALLRAMVEWQEVRLPEVHVLHAGGHAFRLYDGQMRPLPPSGADEAERDGAAEDRDAEDDSLLVSKLLEASPRQLYIYTSEPEAQVIQTLVGIFGERAAVCPRRPVH